MGETLAVANAAYKAWDESLPNVETDYMSFLAGFKAALDSLQERIEHGNG